MRKHKQVRPIYRDGARKCPMCDAPLPAHQTWPGAHYRFCGSSDCAAKVKQLKNGRCVDQNSLICARVNCTNFVSEGRYRKNSFLSCSGDCYTKAMHMDGGRQMICRCGCGRTFLRKYKTDSPAFFSNKCNNEYKKRTNLAQSCGKFLPLLEEYLGGVAKLRYQGNSGTDKARVALCIFFRFINEKKIVDFK